MKKLITILFLAVATTANAQLDTTALLQMVSDSFPSNVTGAITASKLRNVTDNIIRSSFNVTDTNSILYLTTFADLQYIDGNQAEGYVLTSDASGNATWEAASGGGTLTPPLSISHDNLLKFVIDSGYTDIGSFIGSSYYNPDSSSFSINGSWFDGEAVPTSGFYHENGDTTGFVIMQSFEPSLHYGNGTSNSYTTLRIGEKGVNISSTSDTADTQIVISDWRTYIVTNKFRLLSPSYKSLFNIDSINVWANNVDSIRFISNISSTLNSSRQLIASVNDYDQTNWDIGFSAFGLEYPEPGAATATMYALDENVVLDTKVIVVDTTRIKIESSYDYTTATDRNYHNYILDDTGHTFNWGIDGGGTSSPTQKTAKLNDNGFVFPNLSADPTGENGAMYYNTTSNVFRVYENGAWRNL